MLSLDQRPHAGQPHPEQEHFQRIPQAEIDRIDERVKDDLEHAARLCRCLRIGSDERRQNGGEDDCTHRADEHIAEAA